MARYCGNIGFGETKETSPGIYELVITDKKYFGDVIRNTRRLENNSDSTIDNVTINNEISIVADPYAKQNFHTIKYAEWMGNKWKVTNVQVEFPRLILSLGGIYNEA